MKKIFVISALLNFFLLFISQAQSTYSISTDVSGVRSLKEKQQFWSAGHTIKAEMHITQRDGPYAWISYFIPGKYKNGLTAEAKSPLTLPQTISFANRVNMSVKQFSLGWKHYFKGGSDVTKGWSLYGTAGFGIIGGRVKNNFIATIDTALYSAPVLNGESRFKRLSVDFGAGWEFPVSTEIYFYNDLKVWVPSSDYPSKYLLSNRYVPLIASLHLGIRVYFD